MSRLIAIHGGDWADASANYVNVPDELNMEQVHKEYRYWVNNSYEAARQDAYDRRKEFPRVPIPKFYTFTEWLIHTGRATEAEIEIYEEL